MNTNFFTLSYWFNTRPDSLATGAVKYVAFFLLALFVLAFFSFLQKKKKNNLYFRVWESLLAFTSTNLMLGLILLFFSYEGVPYLSIRFFYLLWASGMIWWFIAITKKFKKIPEIKKQKEQEAEYKKYIP